MSALTRRRLVLPATELAALCDRLDLLIPPGFEATPGPVRTDGVLVARRVHRSVAAGLAATCAPRVAVLLRSSVGDVAAAFGIHGDLGGSMVRAGDSDVEVAAWPAELLGHELNRVAPAGAIGPLHLTVVAPPQVVGGAVWPTTDRLDDIGSAVAHLVAAALA